MDEKNWEVALKTLYMNEKGVPKALATEQVIEKNTALDDEEAGEAIEYLKRMGLINPEGMGGHELTEKGFDVAHQRALREERLDHENELAEQRETVNAVIAYLTLALVAVTAIDTAVRAFVGIGETSKWVLALPGISLIAGFLLAYKMTQLELLKP
jgi:hypothetical protein